MRSNRSKACDISPKVRKEVLERDRNRCCYCGGTYRLELAHAFIPRSRGGLGVSKNLITLCQKHHKELDAGKKHVQDNMIEFVESYMHSIYKEIDISKLKYDKNSWLKEIGE